MITIWTQHMIKRNIIHMHVCKHYNFLPEVILKSDDSCFGIIDCISLSAFSHNSFRLTRATWVTKDALKIYEPFCEDLSYDGRWETCVFWYVHRTWVWISHRNSVKIATMCPVCPSPALLAFICHLINCVEIYDTPFISIFIFIK